MSLEQKAQKGMKWKNQKYFVIEGYSRYYATTINDVSIMFSLKQTFSDGLVTQNLDGFWKCHRVNHHFGQSYGTSMYLFLMIFSHSLAMSKHDTYSKIIK